MGKAYLATMTKAPSFGAGPFVLGAAITRVMGTYPGGTAIAGRRYRNNVLIPGATAAVYSIVQADMGADLVYEELVERTDTKVRTWFRSAAVAVGTPTMTKAPSFGAGAFSVGMEVTRVVGDYPGSTPVAGRRYRNNVLIPGATSAGYVIEFSDAGQQLVYEEEVEHNVTKVRKWFRSAAVTVDGIAQPTMTKAPSIGVGPFAQGTTLTRVIGEYPGSTPVAGRRYRNNVLIADATSASYTLVAADVGQQLVYEEEVERNDTKTRQWFRSAAVVPVAAVQPQLPATLNSLDTIVGDMRQRNDFVLKGYESFLHGWYVGPGETHMGNNPSYSNSPTWSIFYNNPAYIGKTAKAMLPWVVIFDGVNNRATNVAVEMRNMRVYMKSRATGTWALLGGPSNVSGVNYGKPNTGLPASPEIVVSRTGTSSTIRLPYDSRAFWHGWWGSGRLPVNAGRHRCVLRDHSGPPCHCGHYQGRRPRQRPGRAAGRGRLLPRHLHLVQGELRAGHRHRPHENPQQRLAGLQLHHAV
jgi:hypothetical protein